MATSQMYLLTIPIMEGLTLFHQNKTAQLTTRVLMLPHKHPTGTTNHTSMFN